MTFAEAGVPAMIGVNSQGIAVTRNALIAEGHGGEPGIPMNAVHYRILSAQTPSDAVSAVLCSRLGSPMNYVIGAPGDAISLEATPADADYVHPTNGIITHANHFTSARLGVVDRGKVALPDSLFRAQRLRRFLEARRGRIDVATIYEGMKDHFNYPDSICRHPDQRDDEAARFESVSTVVMDLDDRTMYVTDGPPCENPYRAVGVG